MTRAEALAERIAAIAGPSALHEPEFGGRERDCVLDCVDTGWVSTAGAYVGRFEEAVKSITGAADAVAVVNGTAALALAYRVAGVHRDDEVVMPALTFVATANAAAMQGAVPHFVDCRAQDLGLDADALRAHLAAIVEMRAGQPVNRQTGRRIGAIVAVHVFGHPCDLDAIAAVADAFGIPLIEDAAAALGSRYGDCHAGLIGRIGAISFNGNKIVTCGGGGAVVSNAVELTRHARHLASTAKVAHPFEFRHDEIAYNYRMPNLNAALGLAQLEGLPDKIAAKRRLADRYRSLIAEWPGIRFIDEQPGTFSIYWLNSIALSPDAGVGRDELLDALIRRGVQARPIWTPMHMLDMYRDSPRADLPVTEAQFAQVVSLPSSPALGGRS